MADTAARWVDRVLPEVPWRQWVLTVPPLLRLSMAWDPELLTRVLSIFQRAIAWRLRYLVRKKGWSSAGARHASVSAIQRWGSALNLDRRQDAGGRRCAKRDGPEGGGLDGPRNVHIHSLVGDGLWLGGESGPPVFVPVCVRDVDVAAVVRRVERRVLALMIKRGLLGDAEDEYLPAAPEVDPERQLELDLLQASASLRIATGARAGKLVRRLGNRILAHQEDPNARSRPMQARSRGFDLHARVRVSKKQRGNLERLARYLLRPALSLDRLRLRDDGLYQYDFRHPWSDGTSGIVLDPMELMEKLAALIPIPRALRGAGAERCRCAPARRPEGRGPGRPPQLDPLSRRPGAGCCLEERDHPPAPGGGRLLLPRPSGRIRAHRSGPLGAAAARSFLVDVLKCARCGGQRELVATVTDPVAVRAILEHLGLDPDDFGPVPAWAPPPRSSGAPRPSRASGRRRSPRPDRLGPRTAGRPPPAARPRRRPTRSRPCPARRPDRSGGRPAG